MTRPTPAQQSWMQADTYARCQADAPSLRSEHAAHRAEPVRHLRLVPDAELSELPEPKYSEDRVLAYFIVAVVVIFAVKHFWGIL